LIVCDASTLIALTDERDAHNERAIEVALADEPLVASVVNLAEALAGPDAERREAHLRDVAGVESAEVPAEAAPCLGDLRRQTKLKMPDCIALELAERGGRRLATFDRRLKAAAIARGLRVLS
jgi:predicted nucleic acid-binding protein